MNKIYDESSALECRCQKRFYFNLPKRNNRSKFDGLINPTVLEISPACHCCHFSLGSFSVLSTHLCLNLFSKNCRTFAIKTRIWNFFLLYCELDFIPFPEVLFVFFSHGFPSRHNKTVTTYRRMLIRKHICLRVSDYVQIGFRMLTCEKSIMRNNNNINP